MLYEQPKAFDDGKWRGHFVKPVGLAGRIRWTLDGFVKEAGLGEMVAADYVRL